MSGNCWEWTRSLREPYPYPEWQKKRVKREALDAAPDEHRVLRGGGFNDNPGGVRGACRGGASPDNRSGLIGFRVVVRPYL